MIKARWISRFPLGKENQKLPYCYHEDKCSYCGKIYCADYRASLDPCSYFIYCPNCGAKMDEEYPEREDNPMTDAKAIACAEALIQFCNEQRGCRNCVFRGHESWRCNISAYTFQNEYNSAEVNANYAAKR